MSKLSGFDEAPVYERLPRFAAGTYVAEVLEMTEYASALEKTQKFFKITLRILEAAPGSKSSAGDEVAEIEQLFGKYRDSAYGRVRAIVGSCTGERGRNVSNDDYDEAVSAENPCKGSKVKVFASPKPPAANGQVYCQLSWMPYRGGAAEGVTAGA